MGEKYKTYFVVAVIILIIAIIFGRIFFIQKSNNLNENVNLLSSLGLNSADAEGHEIEIARFSLNSFFEKNELVKYSKCEEEFDKKEYAVFKQFYQNPEDGVYPIRSCLIRDVNLMGERCIENFCQIQASISCVCYYAVK